MKLLEDSTFAEMRRRPGAGPGLFSFGQSLRSGLHLGIDELQSIQLARLRPLLEHAYNKVPYYRKLFDSVGFRPHHRMRITDLEVIPVTTRAQLQTTPKAEIVAHGVRMSQLQKARTSGSTGVPLSVYRTRREGWMRKLLTLRAFFQNGLKWNDRIVTISRRPSGPAFAKGVCWRIWNLCLFERPDELLSWLRRLRPTVIYGFTTNLAILADLVLKEGTEGPRPRMVFTSSDLLLPGFRRLIAKAFHANPLDVYNCTELSDVAWECQRREGLHVNADWLYLELLRSGQRLAPGQTGEVVVTHLYRYAMPLIRYSPGDVATWASEACPCGLTLPRLARLEGRADNIVPLPGGRFFAGFSEVMSEFVEITRYRITQKALDDFSVIVVPGVEWREDALARIARTLSLKLGPGVRVQARLAQSGELGVQGKCRPVVPIGPVDFEDT